MLFHASTSDLFTGKVARGPRTHVVITMRRYPRFIRRELRDEYHVNMSPDAALLADWLEAKRRHDDHDGAFGRSRFEKRFKLTREGWENLERLAKMSRTRDVILVCNCRTGTRCHREMLLIAAEHLFGARVSGVANDYPEWTARLLRRTGFHPLRESCAETFIPPIA